MEESLVVLRKLDYQECVKCHQDVQANRRAKRAAALPCDAYFLSHTSTCDKWREQWRYIHRNKPQEIRDALYERLTHGPMMVKSAARCEGSHNPLTVAHVVESCAACSD